METEIEGKWLNIDLDIMRYRLRSAGAKLTHPERLMTRANFDYPEHTLEAHHGWVRVRDEGDQVTLSYKQLSDRTLHGTKEVMVVVSSFKSTCELLNAIGLTQTSHQHTKRETWALGSVEVDLDTWPWIPSFIEVEAPSEKQFEVAVSQLNLNMKEVLHGSVEIAYQAVYDVTEAEIDSWPKIAFSAVPEWLQSKRKR